MGFASQAGGLARPRQALALWPAGALIPLGLFAVFAFLAPGPEGTLAALLDSGVSRLQDPWLHLLLTALIALAVAALLRLVKRQAGPGGGESSLFAGLLFLAGLGLTLAVDFVYVRDGFGVRMNTVFKSYYQGWVLLACASAFAVWWIFEHGKSALGQAGVSIFKGFLALGLGACLVYPVLSIYSRAGGLSGTANFDAASGLAQANPDDWAAIHWLDENVQGAPVILEAPGESYHYEGRISAFTGLPTLLGWSMHESQWRGNYDEQSQRLPVIAAIYAGLTLELLHQYGVKYVVLGAPELAYIDSTRRQGDQAIRFLIPNRQIASFLHPSAFLLAPPPVSV